MARGAAQAQRKRPQAQQQKPKPKRKQQTWEDQLFFARLRRHTKWMFVLLALVFAVGFVAFGVGSGSTGISDLFSNGLFGGGGSSGTSGRIKDDQKKIKPKNLDVLGDLARIYRTEAESAKNAAADAQNALGSRAVTPPGVDLNSTLGQALGSDPLTQSLRTRFTDSFTKMTQAYTKAETAYKRAATAARGTSQEANAQLQVGSLAVEAVQATGQQSDIVTAVKAYKRYLKLEPKGVSASQARQTLAQLQAFLPKSRR